MKRHFTEDVFLENTGTIQKSSLIQHTVIYWTSLYFHSFELLTKLFFSSVWLISCSNFMYKGNNIHVRESLWSWKSAACIKLLVPTTKVLEISFYLPMWVGKCSHPSPHLLTDHIPMKNTPIQAVMSLKILVWILTFSRSLSILKKTSIIAQSSFVTEALI